MAVYGPITTAAATGGAGAATGTATSDIVIRGFVVGMYIQYNGSPPAATTDLAIKTAGSTGVLPSYNLLVITDAATDGYFLPQVQGVTAANVASGQYSPFYVEDKITVTMAQANDADSATVWIYMVN